MQKITNALFSHMMLLGLFVFSFVTVGWSQTTTTYNDNGNIYSVVEFTSPGSNTWTVPANVTSVTIKAWGGAGGLGGDDCGLGCGNANGGPVGYTEATYSVAQGNEFGVHPGGKGGNGANSVAATGGGTGGVSPFSVNYNGGLGGHAASMGTSGGGGGGGAATIVELNASVVAVAGGAGGGGGMANLANSGQPGTSATLANGTSNTGGVGASGSSCGKSDGGGAGGGGGGQYGSVGGTTYVASDTECAGNGGYRGGNAVTGATSITSNSFVSWSNNGKVEIIYTPKDLYVDVDATNGTSYSGSGSIWADLTGHNNDLNLVGSPAFNTGFGGYLEFDGTGTQYAEANGFYGSGVFVGSSVNPENWNGNSTYEAWVNPASLNTTTPRLVFGDGNNNEGVIDFRSDRIRAWSSAGIVAEYVASIAANQWYHVVMTHERTTGNNYEVKLFLDGLAVATSTGMTTDNTYGPDNHLRIGYNWDGAIARAKVFNYLRSETEISASYEADKNHYCHVDYTATVPAGSGTSIDPYQIASFENLLWLSEESSSWGQIFVQTANIDALLTSEVCFNNGLGWSPIGNDAINFTGRYDGGGHTISNLYINRPSERYIGLFGKSQNAKIQQLTVGGTIVADWDAGMLVGYAGGASGLIRKVHVNANITVRESGGGLVGHNQGIIRESSAHGSVSGSESNFGGLVGYNDGGRIYQSFATADVSNSHAQKGQVGGLVGALLGSISQVTNCYATGNVSAQANTDIGGVGGLIGRIRTIDPDVKNCYAVGLVSASGGPIGGLIGYNEEGTGSNVVGSFWDTQTTGQASSAGGTAKTTLELNDRSTFFDVGWDLQCETINGINNFWGMNTTDNNAYPFLSWQGFTDDPGVVAGTASANQVLCSGDTPNNLTLSGYIGDIQWQLSYNGIDFEDEFGATTDVLDLQSLNLEQDLYFRAIVSKDGCADISNVVLIESHPESTSTLDIVACDSYIAPDGQEYGESGQYIAVIPNAQGCDSTITINLTMLSSIEVTQVAEACESYTAPDGAVYSTSGQYLAVLERSNGCDSLITINLTIHSATSSTINVESCITYDAPDGQEYVTSGQYQAVVPNAAGCDSTITINLTITESSLELSYTTVEATVGFANGSATVAATGGTGPYTFQWNDSFMQTTETLWGVFPGMYECEVTDAAGCSLTIDVYVPLFTGVPNTKVANSFCNAVNLELGDFIACDNVNNADAFRWEFVKQGGLALPEYTRYNSNYIRLQWVSGIEYGEQYDVRVKARVDGVWGTYANTCVIAMAVILPTSEVRPEYRPTNAQGNNYSICDFIMAESIVGAVNYRWRFDPDWDTQNGNELFYTRNASNPAVRLSWVDGLTPGVEYKVAVSVELGSGWGDYGNVHAILMGAVVQPAIRPQFCGEIYAPNGYVLSTSACEADFYKFEFKPVGGGAEHYLTSANYAAFFSQVSPSLSPGDYEVRVRISQAGVLGEYGPPCLITISGPQGMTGESPTVRNTDESIVGTTLFPNPNKGEKVQLSIQGLPESSYKVGITVFSAHGQQVHSQQFSHQGERLFYTVEFNRTLVSGLYFIQVEIDGHPMTKEKLIVR